MDAIMTFIDWLLSDPKFDAAMARIDAMFDDIEAKFDGLELRMNQQFDKLEQRLVRHRNKQPDTSLIVPAHLANI